MPLFPNIDVYLNSLAITKLGLNWIDIVIILVFLFYGLEGLAVGFFGALFDLLSFVLSFALGLKFYTTFASLLTTYLLVPPGFANAFGFFIAAFLFEVITNVLLRKLFHTLKKRFGAMSFGGGTLAAYAGTLHHLLGIVPGVASSFILLTFLLTVIIALPLSPYLKQSVTSSRIGSSLVANTQGFEKGLSDVFGGAIGETLNFLTVKPQSNETVSLNFTTTDITVDPQAEQAMFRMVNKERTERGLKPLVFDNTLRDLAREYAEDMFARGYFSHYTPDGFSPFDRMANANIDYISAGENLALAPSVDLAMQGLMQSEGHRANILSENFGRVGIGVMDAGIYGQMFVQEFTD